MKKYFLIILLLYPCFGYACSNYVIGFKGKNDIFDITSFNTYVSKNNSCSEVFSWNESKKAINFISKINQPYQIYAYSQGASTVSIILENVQNKPYHIITIGAYKTTNVNFDIYGINYENYFDNSGKGQKSPGIFLNVAHNLIQKEVNKIKGY